jgi:hypothetical protein
MRNYILDGYRLSNPRHILEQCGQKKGALRYPPRLSFLLFESLLQVAEPTYSLTKAAKPRLEWSIVPGRLVTILLALLAAKTVQLSTQ